MKNIALVLILFFSTNNLLSQTEYETNTGIVYKIGDTLKLGQPIKFSSGLMVGTIGAWKFSSNKTNLSRV